MEAQAHYYPNLLSEAPIPKGGILSRTLHSAQGHKVVLFAFDAGQELSEHTAARPALLQILSGHGHLKLGEEELEVQPGSWAYMPAGLVHALRAESPLVMLLTLLPKE